MNRGVDEVQGRLSPYRRLGIGDNSRGRMVPVTSSSFSEFKWAPKMIDSRA